MRSGLLELAKYKTLQPIEEARQKLHKPSCFNFSSDLMFYCLIFHLPNYLIALMNYMIESNHPQLCKKTSCSVKLQGGPLDHNPSKISVDNSWIIILQNNSKCLLLNNKQMPHEILFSLLDEIQNIIKDEHTKIERKEIWNKGKRNRPSGFNI